MRTKFSSLLVTICASAVIMATAPGCNSKPKDADIKKSVETALSSDPTTSTVMVDVNNGVATLSGEVKDTDAQSAAGAHASAVKGVKSVQNNVTVMAATVEITPDDPLKAGVMDATKDYPGATATVNDGVITVTGELNANDWKKLKMALDNLKPKRVDATGLKIK
jgi:hypothetical protein